MTWSPPWKYPRTFHLPWSPGRSSDDKVLKSTDHFTGQEVVVTEKLDGENTTMYPDRIHARSVTYVPHPSRTWVRALHAQIAHEIPPGMRISGENVYALHSIPYTGLPGYFFVFSIWEGDRALSWDDTVEWAELLNLPTVPVLYRGPWDERKIAALTNRRGAYGEMEGYVVRLARSFTVSEFPRAIAKFVRAGHVGGTEEHWLARPVVPNRLGGLRLRKYR